MVYVRQSTQSQVQTKLESKRLQYDLVEEARRHGFVQIEVIDDDLGSFSVHRRRTLAPSGPLAVGLVTGASSG